MHSQDHGVKPTFDEAKTRMKMGLLAPVREAAEREPNVIEQAEAEPEPQPEPEELDIAGTPAMDELVREAAAAAGQNPVPKGEPKGDPVSLSMAMFREAQSDGADA